MFLLSEFDCMWETSRKRQKVFFNYYEDKQARKKFLQEKKVFCTEPKKPELSTMEPKRFQLPRLEARSFDRRSILSSLSSTVVILEEAT